MTVNFQPDLPLNRPRICVIGVGGAGGNAVNNMIRSNMEDVDFVVCNTDAQALAQSNCERRIQLGVNITQGLGAGARSDIGRAAAEEAIDEILDSIQGANMVFVTGGMGGGTGTGAAPVIARIAREQGVLTVGVVTKPFHFEGSSRMRAGETGIEELQQFVDTLIVIPNQNLFRLANEHTTFADAFKMADDVLYSGVRGVTDLMLQPGMVNLDFADIRTVMSEMGKAMMGTGEAEGERRALEAAEAAINNPLLDEVSMRGAKAVLINITGGMDMTLFEVDEAAQRIREEVDQEANIIWGSALDQELEGRIRVSVVATGIESVANQAPVPQPTYGNQARAAANGSGGARTYTFPSAPRQATAVRQGGGQAQGSGQAQGHGQAQGSGQAAAASAPQPTRSEQEYDLEGDSEDDTMSAPPAPSAPSTAASSRAAQDVPQAQTVAQLAAAVSENKRSEAARRPQPGQRTQAPQSARPARSAEGEPRQAAVARRVDPAAATASRRGAGGNDYDDMALQDSPAVERRSAAASRERFDPSMDQDMEEGPFIAPPPVQGGESGIDVHGGYGNGERAARSAESANHSAARSPSLFERVTGSTRRAGEGDRTRRSAAAPRLGGVDPAERPSGRGEAAGRQREEDLLDIPAFLRRQAN